MLSENDSQDEQLDLLCGRFFIAPPHDRLIRNYLPTNLVVRAMNDHGEAGVGSASDQLASLVGLMRMESVGDRAGGRAVLNALSSALFTLVLRAAHREDDHPSPSMRTWDVGRSIIVLSNTCGRTSFSVGLPYHLVAMR